VAPNPPTPHSPWPIFRFSCACEASPWFTRAREQAPPVKLEVNTCTSKKIHLISSLLSPTRASSLHQRAAPPTTLSPIPSNTDLMSQILDLPNIQSSHPQSFQTFLPSTSATQTFPVFGSIPQTTVDPPTSRSRRTRQALGLWLSLHNLSTALDDLPAQAPPTHATRPITAMPFKLGLIVPRRPIWPASMNCSSQSSLTTMEYTGPLLRHSPRPISKRPNPV